VNKNAFILISTGDFQKYSPLSRQKANKKSDFLTFSKKDFYPFLKIIK
jgi:hypothetical protein